jgi:hypothetical protein
MAWESLGIVNLNKEWAFTIPVNAEIFRVQHIFLSNSKKEYLKAVIGQGFIDEKLNIFDTRRLTYREETEIFQFSFPLGLDAHSLFIKRLDDSSLDWSIEIEAFVSSSIEQDFLDYLTTRFGNFMPLFSRAIFNESPEPEYKLVASANCGDKALIKDTLTMLVDETPNRKTLTLQNKSSAQVVIGVAADPATNAITVEKIVLQPTDYYEFQTAGELAYAGKVWAKSTANATIELVEMVRELISSESEGNGYNN